MRWVGLDGLGWVVDSRASGGSSLCTEVEVEVLVLG